jgi:hypothetical protein
LAGQAEGGRHRARDGVRVPRGGQVSEKYPAGERPRAVARYLDREPRFSHAAGSGQRDQPRPGQRALDGGSLV